MITCSKVLLLEPFRLNLTMVAGATDYAARVNVVIAGSDLPDYIYNLNIANPMGVIGAVPQLPRHSTSETVNLPSPVVSPAWMPSLRQI